MKERYYTYENSKDLGVYGTKNQRVQILSFIEDINGPIDLDQVTRDVSATQGIPCSARDRVIYAPMALQEALPEGWILTWSWKDRQHHVVTPAVETTPPQNGQVPQFTSTEDYKEFLQIRKLEREKVANVVFSDSQTS